MIKKTLRILLLAIIVLFVFSLSVNGSSYYIYIDPGHGGIDGGAITNSGIYEKDIVLDISYEIKYFLELNGLSTRMTRTGDYDLASSNAPNRKKEDINNRVKMMNNNECILAISIHANAYSDKNQKGSQVFYNDKSLSSKKMGNIIQENLKKKLGNTNRKAMNIENKYILENVNCPICIVEVGFLSNNEEGNLLSGDSYRRLVAYAISEGIIKYLNLDD